MKWAVWIFAGMFGVSECTPLWGAPQVYGDRVGDMDFRQNDLAELRGEVVSGVLRLQVIYATNMPVADANFGEVFVDTDRNSDTGVRLGADCRVSYVTGLGFADGFVNVNGTLLDLGQAGTLAEAGTNSITLSLPASLWGGQTNVRLFVASASIPGDTDYDRVPEAGYCELASGLAVIPRPGNSQVHLVHTDAPDAAVFPNLTGLEAKVVEGNLHLWLTFGHGVERQDLQAIQDVLVLNIGMDLDRRLWSGFINNHEDPPTFGMDRLAEVMVSDLFNKPQGALRFRKPDDPNTLADNVMSQLEAVGPLGGQETDTRLVVGRNSRFGTAANQVFLSLPLAYLDYDDGEMYLVVNAFLASTLTPGSADSVPESGALDTTVGLAPGQVVHPVGSCAATEVLGTDSPDDSLGFGFQGDEIITTHACALNEGGLKITVDLESLEYSDLAFVNLFVDADGDAGTGIPLRNHSAATMGADFYLSFNITPVPDPAVAGALLVDLRRVPVIAAPQRADHLVSLRTGGVVGSLQVGAHYTVTLPPELLGNPAGATARYVITTSQQSYSTQEQEDVDNPEDWDDPDTVPGVIKVDPASMPSVLDFAPDAGFYQVSAPAPLPLQISSVTPSRGDTVGGTPVVIYGAGFDRQAQVRFGAITVPAQNQTWLSSGELKVLTPANAAGSVTVTVINPGPISASRNNGFTCGAAPLTPPEVRGIEPLVGPIAGGTTVHISGANFVTGATVQIGAQAAGSVVVESVNSIQAVTPLGTIGPATVRVTNPDGQSGELAGGYNYGSRPPVVWTVFPCYGPLAGGTTITVVGERLTNGMQVLVDGHASTQVHFVSDRLVTAVTASNAAPGLKAVTVLNPDGVSGTLAAAYNYGAADPGTPPPTLLGVAPLSSPTGGGVEVTILGTGFQPGMAAFFDHYPVKPVFADPNRLVVVAPPHVAGMVEVAVTNIDGRGVVLPAHQNWDSFTYDSNQPYVSLVYPLTSPTTGGERVTINGSHFKAGATVTFGGFPGSDLDIDSTLVMATTPPHPPGTVDIRITNPGDLSFLWQGDIVFGKFTYQGANPPAPSVQSLSTNSGSSFGGQTVNVRGQNFFAGARVWFGPYEATNATRLSATNLQVVTPPAPMGMVNLKVQNADGQENTLTNAYLYIAPRPVVTSLNPTSGPTVGGTLVSLAGDGFLPGTQVLLASNLASQVGYVSRNALTFRTPPGFPGNAALALVNPGPLAEMSTNLFRYDGTSAPNPQVFSVQPYSGPVAGGTLVEVSGQNFLAGSVATIRGLPLVSQQLPSPTRLTGLSPAGAPGAFDLVVSNRDGHFSIKVRGFTYVDTNAAAPVVNSITPSHGLVSGGAPVVVTGQNFQPGARAYVHQYPLASIVVASSQQILGSTLGGDVGSGPVKVFNPDGKSGELAGGFTYDAVTVPAIASVSVTGGRLSLVLTGLVPGTTFEVQRTSSIATNGWVTADTVLVTTSVTNWSETLPSPHSQAFYRILAH